MTKMKHVNVTIIVTSCDDLELSVKSEYEECKVTELLNNPALNLLKPFVEQLLEMEGANDQPTNPLS